MYHVHVSVCTRVDIYVQPKIKLRKFVAVVVVVVVFVCLFVSMISTLIFDTWCLTERGAHK